jgi:hypothetical protein
VQLAKHFVRLTASKEVYGTGVYIGAKEGDGTTRMKGACKDVIKGDNLKL